MAGMPSEGAAQKAWAVFRSILRKAMRWGLIECDPTIQMKPLIRTEYQPEALDARQIHRFL